LENGIHSDDLGNKYFKENVWTKSEQGVWRIRSNPDIQNMYKSPDIVTEINVRRLEWLGHVVRMEDTSFSFPFPFVPLQRHGCLVARLFL
jgi:hypothetical protein